MQISDLVGHYNNSTQQADGLKGTKGVERLVASLRDLSAGNIFEGTVNSMKNGQVVLGLSNGQVVTARMDGKVPITVGQSMFFQVKSNDGIQIAIRPFTIAGNSVNLTLMDALNAANLPVDAKNLSMVNTMMEEQMSINRNSLAQMARVVQNHPDINVRTLVQMQKLNIPITPEFASQFENYMDDKQAIGRALQEFMSELPAVLSNEQMSAVELKQTAGNIISIITEGLKLPIPLEGEPLFITSQNEAIPLQQTMEPEMMQQNQIQENSQLQTAQPDVAQQQMLKPDVILPEQEMLYSPSSESELLPQEAVYMEDTLEALFTQEEITSLEKQLAGVVKELEYMHLNPKQSTVALLNTLKEVFTGEVLPEKTTLLELFSKKEFQTLVKNAMEQQWLVRPKDLESGDKISKLYEHLEHQLSKIEDVVKATGQEAQNVTQMISDIRSNVEFMNQINQNYTYVQIPLKMSGQNASGELYVYTNKKNLSEDNEELTAFLHLDMDHLGSTDVSLRLQGKDISTRFYFDNDESFDLVQQYLPILEEKLAKKGYRCNLSVVNEAKNVNFVEDFLKKDQPSGGMVHRYSFDMRA